MTKISAPAPVQTLHPCEAEGCEAPCAREHFMCIRHWRMVPKALRDEIWQAWRRFERRRRARQLSAEDAIALREVQARAIAAVREKEIQRDLKRNEVQQRLIG